MSVQETQDSTSAPHRTAQTAGPGSHLAKVVGVSLVAAVVVTIFVLAFTWPTKTSTAHDLPVSVAGPDRAVAQFEDELKGRTGDTFDFVAADSRDQAVDQIKHRETYGAVILSAPTEAPEVLTAPAANSAATQILSGLADQMPTQAHQTAVVPLSDEDSNGSGLSAAAFPLVLGGMIGGVLITFLVKGVWRRLIAALGYGILAGLSLTLILHTWFGFVQGNFGLVWLAFGLSAMATATFILGCTAILGTPGIGVGAVVTLLIGNPLSGAMAPWQFMVEPWGRIGQFLVPGASNTLLRSLSYFPDAPTAQQWWTLVVWVALGVALTSFGHFKHNRINDDVEVLDPERPAPRHRQEQSAAAG